MSLSSLAVADGIQIIPNHVNEANLKSYSAAVRKEIEVAYKRIKDEAFARTPLVNGNPQLTVIFGSSGTGVTTLMDRIIHQKAGQAPVVCNAEKFFGEIESFEHDRLAAQRFETEAGVRAELVRLTEQYLPAGKYMQDRLMEDALNSGRSVMVAKRGRTDNGPKLLKAIQDAGVSLHTIIYQAPLSVKLAGFKSRFTIHHDIGLTDAQIAAEHDNLTRNMQSIADASNDKLSLYFRMKTSGDVVEPIAERKGQNGHIINLERLGNFDASFMDYSPEISVRGLLRLEA